MQTPFYIPDLPALRQKLTAAERDGSRLGRVWASVLRRARNAPQEFPWFTPFAALVTGDARDIENAKASIRRYIETFEPQWYGLGIQFHYWCFAFPHARWTLSFHWLCTIGAWEPEEEKSIREALIEYQFVNFFYGLRVKPEPECVDNQTLSLCFSNALIGLLFRDQSAMAARMYEDGIRRLPSLLGGVPPSGYSGEGSAYMDGVVGPSIPFIVELLEKMLGGDWFNTPQPPLGGSGANVCRMVARQWMPNGQYLPWDHYGYGFPGRACMAYAAHRTGDPIYFELLEKYANWGYDVATGWGYDDLIWTLVWWPATAPKETTDTDRIAFKTWCEPTIGAALISEDKRLYAFQMWDPSEPVKPGRAQVNPNSLVLTAYGSPFIVDGVPTPECSAFHYPDAWYEVGYMDVGEKRRFNEGNGCAGPHSVLIVDGWEGMRASSHYEQASLVRFDAAEKSVTTDVSPIYRERTADLHGIRRKTRLCHERFWLVEDLAHFGSPHHVDARFFLRPTQVPSPLGGVAIETAEGVRLTLLPLLGPDGPSVKRIVGYPARLEGESLQIDFPQTAATCRWLWLAWPEETRAVHEDVSDHWQAAADPAASFDLQKAGAQFGVQNIDIPLTLPPYLQRDLPVTRRWWFRRKITVPTGGPSWLRLPLQLVNPALWINGEPVDLKGREQLIALMEPHIALPEKWAGQAVEITLRTDTGYSQYAPDGNNSVGFYGHPVVLTAAPNAALVSVEYRDGVVNIKSGDGEWSLPYELLELPQQAAS